MKRQTSMAGEYTFGRGRERTTISSLERRTRGKGTLEKTRKSRVFRIAGLGPRPDVGENPESSGGALLPAPERGRHPSPRVEGG